ncbi:MAG: hypothetical protein RLZZ401_2454, partial [Pseudomonadota bacterium]
MNQALPSGMGYIDLSQFHQIFFEETGENIDQIEQMLLNPAIETTDDEGLNAIFRCAHSIKGGAATFGFADVTELTHQMESLLDRLRRREIKLTAPRVSVLLESTDVLRGLLARHRRGGKEEALPTQSLVKRISDLMHGEGAAGNLASAQPVPVAGPPDPSDAARSLEIHVGPLDNARQADAVRELLRSMPEWGGVARLTRDDGGQLVYAVQTTMSNADLLDMFVFHVQPGQVLIRNLLAPDSAALPGPPDVAASSSKPGAIAPAEVSTIRVTTNKVDQLINLVGELVITQAMLMQHGAAPEARKTPQLLANLADLERHTRALQEAVLSMRMVPVSVVFNRFPRMLRDLAGKLGKQVELVVVGETTELDKGLIEKITDPLIHLVRNSCDHGIEAPDERLVKGKPAHGTITLRASHEGGAMLIEVRDDGQGLSRQKILDKAVQRGLAVSDQMDDQAVWQLIFSPGFSTADVVTEVSGRGVGMDVVKRNVDALGGTIGIESAGGDGMRVSVRLPLTLAIMDGLLVQVGQEVYVIPLLSVIELLQWQPTQAHTLGQQVQLINVRDDYLPVVDLAPVLGVVCAPADAQAELVVVVEADGCRVALRVHALLGQQQVVVKSL